ncbi:MAG: ABC transporter permease [Armatimonadetes bacterium]|nr:ABC transporter permease [Armatimonadota bacterium]
MIARNLITALKSLREQGGRAFLSMLGVMVGCLAIILLISIAAGVQRDVRTQVEDLGVNVLVVIPGRLSDTSLFSPNLAGLSYLKEDFVEPVRAVHGVKAAAPLLFMGGGIHSGKKESPTTFVIAAGPDWFKIHASRLAQGRFFSANDEDQPVCVIGSLARDNLFGPNASALGKQVVINGNPYKVVGVTQDKKSESSLFSMGSFENMAYVPFAYVRDLTNSSTIHRIMIQTDPDVEPKALVQSVEGVLGQRLDHDQFSVLTQEDLLKLVFKIMGILTWLLTGLTSIALFVGGVGIMTVMLMAVSERSREIGIRKTCGARSFDIFWQFLFEAGIISLLGGLVGLAISYVACLALQTYTPVKPWVNVNIVSLGMGASLLVGAVFGLIPALNAARKDPVEALRRE